MEQLNQLYREWSGQELFDVEPLTAAGSNRMYVRYTDHQGQSVIGVVGTSVEENQAFIVLTLHFASLGLPVPRLLATSNDERRYLLSDLGTRSLFDAIGDGRRKGGDYSPAEVELLERTLRLLPHVQVEGAKELDWSKCYPKPSFDRESIMFDFNYFKYCFLKPLDVDFHESRLEADFNRMADRLLSFPAETFMYRDFQSRNIMLDAAGNPWLIDYQGGRRGPCYYDLASFLWQASARFSPALRQHLINIYYEELGKLTQLPPVAEFVQNLHLFVAFRTLQVLGAYGFRGLYERKQHFIDSIPPALDNLSQLLAAGVFQPYPHLEGTLHGIVCQQGTGKLDSEESQVTVPEEETPADTSTLTVTVCSFSFKKGIPADESGNGGGYVFDCRATHNPGRYEPFKQLTGLNQPVIDFLEQDGEILTFLHSVYPLAEHHVQRFIRRGFTHLMISFGCTGGQHRSVYCAQHLAEHLHRKYNVKVHLIHREQGVEQLLLPLSTFHLPPSAP